MTGSGGTTRTDPSFPSHLNVKKCSILNVFLNPNIT